MKKFKEANSDNFKGLKTLEIYVLSDFFDRKYLIKKKVEVYDALFFYDGSGGPHEYMFYTTYECTKRVRKDEEHIGYWIRVSDTSWGRENKLNRILKNKNEDYER